MERIYNCEMEMRGSMELAGQPACLNSWTPSSLTELDLKKIRRMSRRYLGWPLNSICMGIHTHTACIPLPPISLSKPHFPQAKYIKSEGHGLCALSSRPFSSSVRPVVCRAVACDCAQQRFSAKGHMVSTCSIVSPVLSVIAQLSGIRSSSLHMCVLWGAQHDFHIISQAIKN